MSTRSPAFARMKAALLSLVNDIPAGRVAIFGDVAKALNIPPRHVAYILSQLKGDEAALVAWHRVVPEAGKFPALAKQTARQTSQIAALKAEGVTLEGEMKIANLADLRVSLPRDNEHTLWADEEA